MPDVVNGFQRKETCDALHGSLVRRVETQADDISHLWKRTDRPTWMQMWVTSILTAAIGSETIYIITALLKQ